MEQWGSRLGALLSLIGGAVGLGNFLRFPFQAGKWGGGAFLVPYVIALIGVGLPLIWIEMALGRAGARHGVQSAPAILHALIGKRGWMIGLLSVYVSLSVGVYYAYLTGWTLGYTYHALLGTFSNFSLTQTVAFHEQFLEREAIIFWLLTWIIAGLILQRGLQKGLERMNLWGIPLLFLLAVGIAGGAIMVGETGRCPTCASQVGLAYLYLPRWTELGQPAVWLAATGQVFFSIGVGFGMYPVYAAHALRSNPVREGFQTAAANTIAEVGLGGLIVIPLVTAFLGLPYVQEKASFSMGFAVMPFVLNEWGGRLLIAAWYFLLFLAALSSLLAMGWVGVTWLSASLGGSPLRWVWPLIGSLILLGIPPIFGYQHGALDLYDQIGGTLFPVIAALGYWWAFHQVKGWEILKQESPGLLGKGWLLILRWLPPLFLGGLLGMSLFQPSAGDWVGAFRHLLHHGHWPWAPEALPAQLQRTLFASIWNLLSGVSLILLAGILVVLRKRA
ncbi:MAG: sodium-dependent transporter [Bacteroidia bacterium]|nr:sodium-dependent transporter [Bacteroidia bacterium]MDW8014575.1 sodium-dependent transporter [Bacteroidia bacterium]